MFGHLFHLLAVLLVAASAPSETPPPLISVPSVLQAMEDKRSEGRPFDLTLTVVSAHAHKNATFTALDAEGNPITLWDDSGNVRQTAREGTRVRLRGFLVRTPRGEDPRFQRITPACREFDVLELVGLPEPRPVAIADFAKTAEGGQRISLTGLLRDAFRDEIDPNFIYLTLADAGSEIHASFSAVEDPDFTIEHLLGERVSLVGFVAFGSSRPRDRIGRQIDRMLHTHRQSIRRIGDGILDPFAVPQLPKNANLPFSAIGGLGRCKTQGFVIAQWEDGNILIQTDDGQFLSAALSCPNSPPYGAYVTVSGIPATDTYRLCLQHARWRDTSCDTSFRPESPLPLRIRDIVRDRLGRPRFDIRLNGRAIRLNGRLILPASDSADACRFHLEQDGEIAKIDCCAVPDVLDGIPNGSLVEISGVLVLKLRSGLSLPRIEDFVVAIRTPRDVRLVRKPSWWTFSKFIAILSVALLILLAMFAWTLTLKRLSERRGAELADERIAVVESELKVYERTRLAIELHDMLSQMLSGISMQIGTVRKLFNTNREKTLQHLDIAEKTLLSCRESLRDCLWDLRNRALEEPDMEKAIRMTLDPHLEDAELIIRFNVSRERLTDNTAHAILSIIRELAVNAFRHGKASLVKVAGCIDGGKVLFSVSDNGCGFDPQTAPGMAQGHFGLQGIRERVEGFGGDVTVASAIGQGAKVTIKIRLPRVEGETVNGQNQSPDSR